MRHSEFSKLKNTKIERQIIIVTLRKKLIYEIVCQVHFGTKTFPTTPTYTYVTMGPKTPNIINRAGKRETKT